MIGGVLPAFDDDVWELYDGSSDYSQAHNLAAEQPERLAELQRLWLIEATKYQVLPLDDRGAERLEPGLAGRPTLIHGTSQLFFPGMGRLSENSVVSIKNKSFSVTADVDVPASGADGVIIAQGGRFGGWAFYAKDGKAKFVYNVLGIHEFATEATEPIPPAPTRCASSSPTTAAASPKAVTSPCTTTAPRSARAVSGPPSR